MDDISLMVVHQQIIHHYHYDPRKNSKVKKHGLAMINHHDCDQDMEEGYHLSHQTLPSTDQRLCEAGYNPRA